MTDTVRGALQALYDDCMEYIRINNLAGAENNHVLRQARAALAQSDVEPNDRVVHRNPNCEKITAVRKAIKEAWLVHGEKTDLDADSLALAAIDAIAQSDAGPSIDEDAIDEAFDKFMEGQEYKQSGNQRLFFHAGVEFGLRHAHPPCPDVSAGLIEAAEQARDLLIGQHNVASDAYKAFCVLNAAISHAYAADRSGK